MDVPTITDQVIRNLMRAVDQLHADLAESVRLQSHYAALLNQYDGGERMTFDSGEAWRARLQELRQGAPEA